MVADHHIFRDAGRDRYLAFNERPGLKALLDAARSEAHPIDIVLVDASSRFSRKFQEMLSVYSSLSKAGVKVHVAFTVPTPTLSSDVHIAGPEVYAAL